MLNAKNKKKGFTIVELVIVIAVIAILSAVLIPTFVSLVNKAKKSADMTTVANINRVLSTGEVTNGKPKTYTEMLAIAEEGGFVVEKLSPSSQGYNFVWDKNTNKMYLYDENGKFVSNQSVKEPKESERGNYWYLVKTAQDATNAGKNVYLSDETATSVTANAGIEVAGATNVTLETTASGTFDICLNGGNLTVNAPNADVNSYGKKGEVTIVAVKGASYHENGKVAFLKVENGHVVVEDDAYVEVVYKTSATATVEKSGTATINNAFADSDANKANGSSGLVFETTTKTESTLKTDAKNDLENFIRAEEGYVAKAGDDYYKSVAEAIEKADRVYITADTAEDVTLKSDSVVIVNEGVNYTGTVSRVTNEVEVTSDLTVYAGSYNAVMANYHSFSPVTKEVTVKLLRDLNLATKQTVKSSANLVFDLNGKTINSTYNAMGTLFVVSGNFTLKSSVEGAKINLLTKAGLVEVASSATDKVVNISNIDVTRTVSSSSNFILCRGTINVEDSTFTVENTSTQTILVQTNGIFNVENSTIDIKKSTSSASVIQLQINSQLNVNNSTMNFDGANSVLFATQDYASISIIGTELTFDNCLNKRIFSLKGNLTLGEGTVVNFNCKSAGLISSTFGGIEVVIDGAEINFADFSVNGGSFIELSSSSKLTITDSELSVLLYESSFGLPKFVKGATDVTISNLTTNIKGNPSGKTYTIDPSTAVWSAN